MSQVGQAASPSAGGAGALDDEDGPVWWDEWCDEWRTHFPPGEDHDGEEAGEYGDEAYSRTLSTREMQAFMAVDDAATAERAIVEGRERDLFFGFAVAPAEPAPDTAPEAPPAADEPPALSDGASGKRRRSRAAVHIAGASCVEPVSAHLRAGSGAFPMSIFGKIKDAIFGHKAAAAPAAPQAPAAQSPVAQAPAGQTPGETPAMPQMQQPAAAPQPVDVENVLMVFETERGTSDLNWRSSIVDLMKLIGLDSSLDNRKELATELGYTGAKDGSAEMNIWLHKAVMRELAKSGGTVPASLKD